MGSVAEIAIRVVLHDEAKAGIAALTTGISQLGMAGIAGLAASFLLFGAAIIYSAVQFAALQTAMNTVQIATGAAAAQMKVLQTYMINLGGSSIYSLDQLAKGMAIVAQFGFKTVASLEAVTTAGTILGEALNTTPVVAFELLAKVMRNFQIPAAQAQQTADMLFYAFQHGSNNVAQLEAGFGQLGGIASLLHIKLADLIPAFDFLSPIMGSAALAGNALYFGLSRLVNPTITEAALQKQLGISFHDSTGHFIGFDQAVTLLYNTLKDKSPAQQFQILSDLMSVRGAKAFELLVGKFKDYEKGVASFNAANQGAGQSAAAAALVTQSLAGQFTILKTNVVDTAALIGQSMGPSLLVLVGGLGKAVVALRDFTTVNGAAVAAFLLTGLAISGIALAVIVAMSPLGALIGIFLAVVVGTALLAAGITMLVGYLNNLGVQSKYAADQVAYAHAKMALGIDNTKLKTNYDIAHQLQVQHADLETQLANTHDAQMRKILLADLKDNETAQKNTNATILGLQKQHAADTLALQKTTAFQEKQAEQKLADDMKKIDVTKSAIDNAIKDRTSLLAELKTTHDKTKAAEIQHQIDVDNAIIAGGQKQLKDQQTNYDNQKKVVDTFHKTNVADTTTWIDNVRGAINTGNTKITNAWTTWWGDRKKDWKGFWDIVSGPGGIVVTGIGNAVTAITTGMKNANTSMNTQFGFMKTTTTQGMNGINSSVSTGIVGPNGLLSQFQGIWGKISVPLGQVASNLWNTGVTWIQNLANGLWSHVANALGPFQWLADQVQGLLGHSTPKEGPLRGDDQWMPHMMQMLEAGVKEGTPKLQMAFNVATSGIANSMASVPSMANYGYGGYGNMGGNITVPIIIDGRFITEVVINRITGQLQSNGMSRAFR